MKQIKRIIAFVILGSVISMILFLLIIDPLISNSCDYHEPLNKKPNWLFNAFYYLSSGHPSPKATIWVTWLITGAPLGYLLYKLKEKKADSGIKKNN